MRYRHRLSRCLQKRRRLEEPRSENFRPQQPGQAALRSRFRARRRRAGRQRRSAATAPRADPAGQPRLFRLRHGRQRHAADRRPRQADQRRSQRPRSFRADGREYSLCAARPARSLPADRRAHRVSSPRDGYPRFRPQRQRAARGFCRDRERVDAERMPRIPANGFFRGHHEGIAAVFGVELPGPGSEGGGVVSGARGGRFGAHSSNESFTPIYYKRLLFVTYFNAGVRAVDVRDPYRPKEIAYYIPAITDKTDKRCVPAGGGGKACKVAVQTNNVEVDDRGYIYIVDRANTGMHILELTGDARKLANFPK